MVRFFFFLFFFFRQILLYSTGWPCQPWSPECWDYRHMLHHNWLLAIPPLAEFFARAGLEPWSSYVCLSHSWDYVPPSLARTTEYLFTCQGFKLLNLMLLLDFSTPSFHLPSIPWEKYVHVLRACVRMTLLHLSMMLPGSSLGISKTLPEWQRNWCS
jgi:hypothetical protein